MIASDETLCVELVDRVGPLQIIVGADEVLALDGGEIGDLEPRLQAAARLAPNWARRLIAFHQHSPFDLVVGVRYVTARGTEFVIREGTLEEVANAVFPLLRSARGLQLRRAQANRIADVFEALLQRAQQPCRRSAG
ncbi:MAG TPA: hypothetical protein VFW04_02210 [Gemmatimonadaceae bacterium]|nr:hypothetical protein [Gemmatimonadaceae bacterium]